MVTIHHNVEAVFQMDCKSPLTLWGLTSWFVKRNEKKAYQQSDLNIFLSAYDKDMMQKRYGPTASQHDVVVGVYVPQEPSQTKIREAYEKPSTIDVAISGCLYHVQTELGIRDFAQHYEHLYRKVLPSSRLIITGKGPGEAMKEYATRNGIVLVPNPENISEALKNCSIYLCPVNVGSGVKYRILDGLRLGMPILTHEVSARGYDMFTDKPWFQSYHDAESFEKGLKSILDYIDQHDNFRGEIVQEYQSVFSFEAGDRRFMKAFSNLDKHI